MTRTIIMALAGLSLVAGSQALAQGRGNGNGRLGNGVPAGAVMRGGPAIVDLGIDARSQGRTHASERALLRANSRSALRRDLSVDHRTHVRSRSRGPDHASDRALSRASERSVLRNRTIVRGARRPHR